MNPCKRTVAALLAGVVASTAFAAEQLFDFSVSDCGWKSNSKRESVKRSGEYPVTGKQGLLFSGPKWNGGQYIWPSFETRSLPAKDWSRYDRLAITVFNDSAVEMDFDILISDSKKTPQNGARFNHKLAPYIAKQLVLSLKPAFAAKKVDPTDIAVIHCHTENPASAMRFFVGNFTLLEPGEAVPELPKSYLQKIRRRQNAVLAPLLKQVETEAASFDFSGIASEAGRRLLRERVDSLLARFRGEEANALLFAAKNGTLPEWDSLRSLVSAISGFAALRQTVAAAPGFEDVLLGYATPMEKVLPRAPVFRPLPETIVIEAARNEKEAAQLIVMPLEKERKKVGVRLTSFTGPAGALPGSALSAAPVGFVETTFVPRSGSEYVGFWPDPLLSFLDAVDVKAGEAQMFWIRAEIPAGQPAGVYTGKADVTIDGQTAFSIPVSVRVRDFALPDRSMLPLAVTFWPNDESIVKCNPNFDPAAKNSPDYPFHAWKKHKKEWLDLLSGYYLSIDSLYQYRDWEPEFELLAELDKEGKLGLFNLGSWWYNPAIPDGPQKIVECIRPRYEKAKQLGLLDHAYIYGADEAKKELFPGIERTAAILKKEFPGVPIFTTALDESYGTDGQIESVDWFCPITLGLNAEQAAVARKAGKQVWWYICMTPIRPFANNFIESSGIETRLLLGAMSAKYRPDGFLYYQTAEWSNSAPLASGPYTDWNAQSYPGYNGDGSWTYPGPDSTPLGSIRLENFRDGLDDYAYVKLLEQRLSAAKQAGKNPQWQRKAEAALAVPATLVKSLTEYTRDPRKVYAWRSRLAELIEAAPVKE